MTFLQRGEGSETARQREERWCSRFVGRRQRSPGSRSCLATRNNQEKWECGAVPRTWQWRRRREAQGKKRGCLLAQWVRGWPCTPCSSNKGSEVSGLQGLWKKRRAKKKVDESLVASSGLRWSPSGPLRPSASRRAALRCRVASQDKAGGPALEWFGFSGCGLLWTGSTGSGVFSVGSCSLLLFF